MLVRDIQYALRLFARNPGFVAMAVLALGFGIGANSVIFSFLNVYLMRPLPSVNEADRVVIVNSMLRGSNRAQASYPDFLDWQQQNHVFQSLTAIANGSAILTGRGEPERVSGTRVSSGFFDVFTVHPTLGRAFLPAEHSPGGEPVVVIGNGFCQRQFGGKPDAIGQSLMLDGVSHKIVGIMPADFRFGTSEPDYWAPLALDTVTSPRGRRMLGVRARLKPSVSLATAQAEMDTIARRLEMQFPDTNANVRASIRNLVESLGDGPRQSIDIMMGVVVFVLLIACANVANLQLARATGRVSEVAIRTAMGARRSRIIRQVLTESVMVAILGGLLGLALAYAGAKILLATIPAGFHPINENFLNGTTLAFTAGVALMTGIVSGLAPAFQISRVNVNDTLKEGGRSGGGGSKAVLRSVLVVAEVSLAMVLLVAAGLLIKSFSRLQEVNPGFRVDGLLTANVWLPEAKYPRPELRFNFFRDLVEKVAAIPGVQSASASTSLPMTGTGPATNFVIDGKPLPPAGHEFFGGARSITPGYLQTAGIPLRRGRYFTEQDADGALRVAIVNERLAHQFFAGEDPMGKRLKWSRDPQAAAPWMTIVGIAGDVKQWSLDSDTVPEMYAPVRQAPTAAMWLAIRTTAGDPSGVVPAVRSVLHDLDPDQPITAVRSMQNLVEESMVVSKYMTTLIGIFAGIALLMAAMGIYGVISYSVAQRTAELGIRIALGAGSGNVVQLVLKQAAWVVGIGIAIGVPGAAAVTKVLQSYLYGVGARDPVTFVVIPAVLAGVALAASYLPARRATRVDPLIALRYE